MTVKATAATLNAALNATGIKEQFAGSFLFIYSGTVPATADEALDMVAAHTELCKISVDGDGVTGLTFGTPAAGVLPKTPSETWTGTNNFDGFAAATSPQAPSFFRLCAASDDGRGLANASTGYRIQGSVGGPGSGKDLVLATSTMADGDPQPIGDAEILLG